MDVAGLVWLMAVEIEAIRAVLRTVGTRRFYRIAIRFAQAYTSIVTPTSAAYGRDNPRLLGRGPEKLSGLRVWAETPGPPVLGKER